MTALIDRLLVTARLDDSPAYRGSVHEDATARAQGFRAALIPGAFVIDYASRLAVERWGRAWIERGRADARFRRPVFDGDRLTLSLSAERDGLCPLTVENQDGEVVLAGAMGLGQEPPHAPEPVFLPHAEPRVGMGAGEVRPGLRFGTADRVLSTEELAASRAAMGQDNPIYARDAVAHAAALVRLTMGDVLRSFAWPSAPVFTALEATFFKPVRAGQRVRTSASVIEAFERKGRHYFVSEEWLWADDRVAARHVRTNLYAGPSA